MDDCSHSTVHVSSGSHVLEINMGRLCCFLHRLGISAWKKEVLSLSLKQPQAYTCTTRQRLVPESRRPGGGMILASLVWVSVQASQVRIRLTRPSSVSAAVWQSPAETAVITSSLATANTQMFRVSVYAPSGNDKADLAKTQ